MAIKRRQIALPPGSVQALTQRMNVTRATVYNALNYSSNSETAQLIRKLALTEYRGVEMKKIVW